MLTFRSASIGFLFLAVSLALLTTFFNNLLTLKLLLILIPVSGMGFLVVLCIGSVRICSGFYLNVFCRKKTTEKIVALTFDDGPDSIYTIAILDVLEKQDVPAVFFVIGRKAELHQDILRIIDKKNHLIGNHSYSHAFLFDLFGRKKMERDLIKTDDVIRNITGKKPVLFRPPYGVTNPVVAKVVKKLDYKAIGWSVRSLDTVKKDENKLVKRIRKGLHPGAVILMHDDREITAKVLEKVILMVKNEGYRFVGLKEMIDI
jgi:peptidoglycan-N-acetylglucosamine deacetylase